MAQASCPKVHHSRYPKHPYLLSNISLGNYLGQIDQNYWDETGADNEAPNDGNSLLYLCEGGRSGVINLLQVCVNGCKDNGNGVSDACMYVLCQVKFLGTVLADIFYS